MLFEKTLKLSSKFERWYTNGLHLAMQTGQKLKS